MDIPGNIAPQIVIKIVIYLQDIVRMGSRTAVDVWV
jgi:hypothetical protein